MDKFTNEDDLFLYLLFQSEHYPTCMEAIRYGRPVSAELVENLIKVAPDILKEILKLDFTIRNGWDYFNDRPDDDSERIFELCRGYFGDKYFFKIVLTNPHLSEHFIDYFEKVDFGFLYEFLAKANDAKHSLRILHGPAVQGEVCKFFDAAEKDRFFDLVRAVDDFSEDDYIYCFGVQYCLQKGLYSLYMLELAYWDFDDDQKFWEMLRDYPEAIKELRQTEDAQIIESMFKHGLL